MPSYKKDKGIISLITILTVGLFSLSAVIISEMGALKELAKNRNNMMGEKSFYAAETATREGAYQYLNNTSYSGGALLSINNVLDSSNIVDDDSLPWPYVEIIGAAENETNHREVIHKITVFPEGQAFSYAVYSQNSISFGGNATVNGDIFANNNINFNGQSATINGNAFSINEIDDTDNINGEAVLVKSVISAPQIDTQSYKDVAVFAETFFTSSSDAENYINNNTRTAVVFVEDSNETKIHGTNTKLSGSLVVSGDLEISGGTYTATDNYAAIIVGGNLKISGGAIINGIVYVSGSTAFGGGNNVINGSLLSTNGASIADITGSTVINFDPDNIGAWQDLEGLITTSTQDPEIVDWLER
ncbi:MAG: hypothetical protein Athens071424_15 [Parcubacteria group bacterium Athens0714_24]|nr:MAG: hypothetical protein Athens071424_15 [Parcubacteria group bacterium Athens0714_24]